MKDNKHQQKVNFQGVYGKTMNAESKFYVNRNSMTSRILCTEISWQTKVLTRIQQCVCMAKYHRGLFQDLKTGWATKNWMGYSNFFNFFGGCHTQYMNHVKVQLKLMFTVGGKQHNNFTICTYTHTLYDRKQNLILCSSTKWTQIISGILNT